MGMDFVGFREALGFRESSGDYSKVNEFGFLGKYQFGKPRLYDLGLSIDNWKPRNRPFKQYMSSKDFRCDRMLQDRLFSMHVAQYKRVITVKYSSLFGKKINGVVITLSGLIAGAHLKGPGGIADFLKGDDNSDANGTKVSEYVRLFAGYDLDPVGHAALVQNRIVVIRDSELVIRPLELIHSNILQNFAGLV